MQLIENYISSYLGIEGEDLSVVSGLFKPQVYDKHDYFLSQGDLAQKLGFIADGYMRVYAPNSSGSKDVTQWIGGKDSFITDLSSFIFNTPSRWYIQALSPCRLYAISRDDYEQLGVLVSNWPHLEKLFLTKCFSALENRIFDQLSMSAEEKFTTFFEANPSIFNEVPLQYIASMLGMTPETLSRLRKKISS